jgi:hypothetical protein
MLVEAMVAERRLRFHTWFIERRYPSPRWHGARGRTSPLASDLVKD